MVSGRIQPRPPASPRPAKSIQKAGRSVLPALPPQGDEGPSPRRSPYAKELPPAAPHHSEEAATDLSCPLFPPAMGASLDSTLSMLALEEWHGTHGSSEQRAGHSGMYESQLLYCELQFRKLDRLASRLRPPNSIVAALACDLLRASFETLPQPLQRTCLGFMKYIDASVYSNEVAAGPDIAEMTRALGPSVARLPHFAVARRQQGILDRCRKQAEDLQRKVEIHMSRRKHILDFIVRLQRDERVTLQRWVFQFWTVTFRQRRAKIDKLAQAITTKMQDVVTPFVSWRLYVAQARLDNTKEICEALDSKASSIANQIAEVELENELQQKKLQDSLQTSSALKGQCQEEQQEHARLQRLWEATQPELLLSVLSQTLEFFFTMVIQQARFSKLQLRQALKRKDVAPLLVPSASVDDLQAGSLILSWLNRALDMCRSDAEELLQSASLEPTQVLRLEAVRDIDIVHDIGDDLADGSVLCALYAILKASKDGVRLSPADLWPLDERDLDLRAEHLCSCLYNIVPTPRARSLLAPFDLASGDERVLNLLLASLMLDELLLPDLPASMPVTECQEARRKLDKVLICVEEYAGLMAHEPLEDPTPLLHGGEDYHALSTTPVEQLLLRWLNVHLTNVYSRPVENFGSDLQDGVALSLILTVIAPELLAEPLPESAEERAEEVAAVASRFTDFEMLTPLSVTEGQSDMMAAFLAQLFLSRPNLAAKKDSLLAMHLRLLESVCEEGYVALETPEGSPETMQLCSLLESKWVEITLALHTIQDVSRTMQGIYGRMRVFLGDTLACRARGQPRTMLDAKEAREYMFYTTLNPERLVALSMKEPLDTAVVNAIESTLRKHFRLLRDVFRHYATSSSGISLEALLKLYQDCKLRSRDLAPHHLEVLCQDHLETGPSGERVLAPQGFIEVMLQCANLKFKSMHDTLSNQLAHLIESHLRPYACHETESMFQRMAYDQKVRAVLEKHATELQIVFELYAKADNSTSEALQRVNTMNITEFKMLLVHCDFLDDTLTEVAVQQIFEGIQHSSTADGADHDGKAGGDDDAGLGDDEELAFSEFLDGLVAIAAFKYPDPFTPFFNRVNSFILAMFAALRRHWSRKRVSPQVDAMLNALQKKLK